MQAVYVLVIAETLIQANLTFYFVRVPPEFSKVPLKMNYDEYTSLLIPENVRALNNCDSTGTAPRTVHCTRRRLWADRRLDVCLRFWLIVLALLCLVLLVFIIILIVAVRHRQLQST